MKSRELSNEFIHFMIKIKKYIRAQVRCEKLSKTTEQQFRTLMSLKKLKKCTLKELSKSTNVSTSSLCIMLNKLCEEGKVERETDKEDRRNTFYNLSGNGEKFLEDELENKLGALSERMDRLTEEQKNQFSKNMKEILEIMDILK